MVSPLSARLLANSGDSSCSGSRGESQKRAHTGLSRPRTDANFSGYSADREDPSISPPLNSIDLHGDNHNSNPREPGGCNKRRKRNELEFAATSVKADLARAGVDFRQIEKDKDVTSCLGEISINLKGVRLMFSSELKTPIISSNVCARSSTFDYEALAFSCWDSYPNLVHRGKESKPFSSDQESDRSTSSFSDTESDSAESSGNGTSTTTKSSSNEGKTSVTLGSTSKVLFIPPNLDDHLETDKHEQRISITEGRPCNIIVSPSNAVTLSQVLQLSKIARLVTKTSAPFSVIHANAAFARLCGLSSEKIVGRPFGEVEDTVEGHQQTCLKDCLVASSSGNFQKISIRPGLSGAKPTECLIKVSPIVARISETSEVMAVEYFSIELFSEDDASPGRSVSPMSAQALAVGVMG